MENNNSKLRPSFDRFKTKIILEKNKRYNLDVSNKE